MSTTKHLQRKPDFYQNQEECKLHTRNRINNNQRYRHFTQTHFTAGMYNNSRNIPIFHFRSQQENRKPKNIWKNTPLSICNKFVDLSGECISILLPIYIINSKRYTFELQSISCLFTFSKPIISTNLGITLK